ncbi:hypothetical protein [Micromonospora sp. MH99]|uniref:hypothetical protein n=1 Tax=Micromonospora sp. MH99 TaxID=1945510 RepID=UPI001F44255F|nr:hypothetical protein [Micromonospora sp. MH99]MCF0092488.1 hypothetical protein [Micromonospora sp. MH99]
MSAVPPMLIDGARVRLFANLGPMQRPTGATVHSVSNFNDVVDNLAIAQYGDDEEFYLFYCTNDWDVVSDTSHPTESAAVEQAEFEFVNLAFVRVENSGSGSVG